MEIFNSSLEVETEFVLLNCQEAYLDLAYNLQLEENIKYLHYIKYRNLIIKTKDSIYRVARNKLRKITNPDFNCELRLTYLNEILNCVNKSLKIMSCIIDDLVPSIYTSGTRDDSVTLPIGISDYFQSLFTSTHSTRIQAIEYNRPLRLRKLAFNKCVDTILDTGRVFNHTDRISQVFNTQFIESLTLKRYILSKYENRCQIFGHIPKSNLTLNYILYENDEKVSRVINYLN